jgi:4-aminobutyrate aminotransferase-like enzyme
MDPTLARIYGMSSAEINEAKQHLMVGGGTPGPILVRGKGVRVEDIDGKSYIDCTSQSWALYLGYANDEINQAILGHVQNLTHVHQGFDTLPRFHLVRRLVELAPPGMDRVGFTVGGGPAIESAIKVCMHNRPVAKEFISLWDGYHGTTFGSASASWIATQAAGHFTGQMHFLPLLHTFHRVPNPYCYRCHFGQEPETCDLMCAEMLKLTIQKGVNGPAGGVIMEPIQASGGQIIFPKRYLQRVREICDETGVPLVFDEIQTFCRIGEWFAAQYFEVTPDVIVLGKALGAGLPLACILISDKLEGLSPQSEDLHTFANNSVAQVTAAKQLDIIERDGVLGNARRVGKYIADGLREMQEEFPEMGDIRAVGLHIGVEYVSDPETKEPTVDKAVQVREEGMRLGAFFGLGGAHRNVLKIKPPLIINQAEAGEVLDILHQAMRKTLRNAL